MNTKKIDVVQKQNTGSFNCYSGKGIFSRQPWKMGFCFQPDQLPASEGGSTKQIFNLGSTPTTIAGHFGCPAASAFYATEFYMGFPECDSYPADSATSSYPSSKFDPAGSQSKDTQNLPSCENQSSTRTPYRNSQVCDILFIKSNVEDAQPYRILRENQNRRIEPSSRFQLRRQPVNPSHSTSVASNKTRIRWTQDLHKRFVESVNCLGGAEKNSEKRTCADVITKFDPETGLLIAEGLRLQLEVQRHLHEQLEIQRNLQLQIEEQGKQLKKMLDSNRNKIRP
ncbi:hypothetical protein PVL29_017789 [Vitis rotundifolia]|uniref:MYB-CC type transcription factor LHEQLE-containing domain-containing protein n=1 Tax=Vitis rotundifolia TaxID=103349 RepID=A0AA39DJ38_VITRO|nr:hypothetical protein PVL29_017789 [Vitis rotundifolia]